MPIESRSEATMPTLVADALRAGDFDVETLFRLARDRSRDSRGALFEAVQDLFLKNGEMLSDRERALMGEILRQLIHDVEMEVRKRLADQLATRTDTPHALVVELANQEFEVAHQILIQNQILQDADLIEIVKHRTMQHQLAVSMRSTVSEEVSQALVETGDEDVITSLLNNHGAAISREVMEYLVSESKRMDSYQNPLVRRPDLPTDLAQRMYWWVSAALRKHIAANFDIDASSLDDAIEAATAIQLEDSEGASSTKPEDLVDRLAALDELDASFLIKALRQGEVSLFEAGLCKLSGLRPKLLRRILFEPGGEALALLCRAIGLDTDTFMAIFELTRRAGDGGAKPSAAQHRELVELYRKTRQHDANRVLRRWRRSSDYLFALKQVGADG